VKHRHKLAQAQRRRAAPRNTRFEADEASDEQPQPRSSRAKSRATHHMKAEGGRTKHRLDKFRRGGRSTKRYDDGGTAGGTTAPTRPNDPGGEIAAANKGRKSTLDWIRDELTGGTKPAYKHGGRSKKYAAGGPAGPDPTGGMPSGPDFISTPTLNPITRFVQGNIPPNSRYLKQGFTARPPVVPTKPGVPTSILLNSKRGGRIHKNRGKEK
jgi:hypothetical protein